MRRRYEAELIPQAIAMGISYEEFWKLNPRSFNVIAKGYNLWKKEQDAMMWLQGGYIFDAVSLAVGNAFRKKGQRPKEYFKVLKEPFLSQSIKDESNMTESEKKNMTEQLFHNLEIQMANFNLQKKSGK